jgi:hypothetical protein
MKSKNKIDIIQEFFQNYWREKKSNNLVKLTKKDGTVYLGDIKIFENGLGDEDGEFDERQITTDIIMELDSQTKIKINYLEIHSIEYIQKTSI